MHHFRTIFSICQSQCYFNCSILPVTWYLLKHFPLILVIYKIQNIHPRHNIKWFQNLHFTAFTYFFFFFLQKKKRTVSAFVQEEFVSKDYIIFSCITKAIAHTLRAQFESYIFLVRKNTFLFWKIITLSCLFQLTLNNHYL